ncbi:MAG: cell division protein ZipA [Pseudomonadales bacterium]|nr:cell division protein ZipA [Pseudomonadales bacterium]
MELSIRDWMVVIGVLLLLAVGLDGYRRSQKDRKNRVRVSKTAKRRARQGTPQEDLDVEKQEPQLDAPKLTNSALGIKKSDVSRGFSAQDVDPLFENPFEVDPSRLKPVDPAAASFDEVINEIEDAADDLAAYDGEFQHSMAFESADAASEPDEILVLNVLSNQQPFSGEDLQHILRACDCRFGEMNIFHRYEDKDARGQVQFSIVNLVEPGTFNLKDINAFSTPGVSFFLRLPGPKDPVEAYNCMVEVAQCLVRNLDGVLKDEMHSAVTEQTIEHNRQRIRDYQQRKLLSA